MVLLAGISRYQLHKTVQYQYYSTTGLVN